MFTLITKRGAAAMLNRLSSARHTLARSTGTERNTCATPAVLWDDYITRNISSSIQDVPSEDQQECSSNSSSTVQMDQDENVLLAKSDYELHKAEGLITLPKTVTDEQWSGMAAMGYHKRKKYLTFLFKKEMMKAKEKKTKERRRASLAEKHVARCTEPPNPHLTYGLWHNTMFLKKTKSYMQKQLQHKVFTAKLYGQPIVFDCSYDECMQQQEKKELANQLQYCINLNLNHKDPFYMHFCNFDPQQEGSKHIMQRNFSVDNEAYPLDIHRNSYLDVFEPSQLVYLSPHCSEELESIDPDAVYIIGGLVDKGKRVAHSVARAQAGGVAMRRLPLERFLDWGDGNKSLTLNQVFGIMLELRHTGSWTGAFDRHIPKRKLIKREKPVENL